MIYVYIYIIYIHKPFHDDAEKGPFKGKDSFPVIFPAIEGSISFAAKVVSIVG